VHLILKIEILRAGANINTAPGEEKFHPLK
jgi:hypothetical protein